MPCSCSPRRVELEDVRDAKKRWDAGGEAGLKATCTSCGETWQHASAREIDKKQEERANRYRKEPDAVRESRLRYRRRRRYGG